MIFRLSLLFPLHHYFHYFVFVIIFVRFNSAKDILCYKSLKSVRANRLRTKMKTYSKNHWIDMNLRYAWAPSLKVISNTFEFRFSTSDKEFFLSFKNSAIECKASRTSDEWSDFVRLQRKKLTISFLQSKQLKWNAKATRIKSKKIEKREAKWCFLVIIKRRPTDDSRSHHHKFNSYLEL